jgi:hypothetical protein
MNPYRNPVLKKLFERGKLNPGATPPPQFAPKPKPQRAIRASDRSARASGGPGRSLGGRSSGYGSSSGAGNSAFGRPMRYGQGAPQQPPLRPRRPDGW